MFRKLRANRGVLVRVPCHAAGSERGEGPAIGVFRIFLPNADHVCERPDFSL